MVAKPVVANAGVSKDLKAVAEMALLAKMKKQVHKRKRTDSEVEHINLYLKHAAKKYNYEHYPNVITTKKNIFVLNNDWDFLPERYQPTLNIKVEKMTEIKIGIYTYIDHKFMSYLVHYLDVVGSEVQDEPSEQAKSRLRNWFKQKCYKLKDKDRIVGGGAFFDNRFDAATKPKDAAFDTGRLDYYRETRKKEGDAGPSLKDQIKDGPNPVFFAHESFHLGNVWLGHNDCMAYTINSAMKATFFVNREQQMRLLCLMEGYDAEKALNYKTRRGLPIAAFNNFAVHGAD